MAEESESPVFDGRYRFQPVDSDWDRGRSGYTHLIFDKRKGRLGVIKRAEIKSQQAVESLRNEVKALLALRGQGVPEVYDIGEAAYDSNTYFYIVIEYIDGIRVEKQIVSLTPSERARILTQLFNLLSKAHRVGIVHGDIDLKHLFWRRDEKKLIVIDWGSTTLNVDSNNKTEFAYDLARAAEIIYALVTYEGQPPAAGSVVLPDDVKLIPDLIPLPIEYRTLCTWAPRTPSVNAQAPYTAGELSQISNKWSEAIGRSKPEVDKSVRPTPTHKRSWLIRGIPVLGIIFFLLLAIYTFSGSTITSVTPTFTFTEILTPFPPTHPPIATKIAIPTDSVTLTPVATQTPLATQTHPIYSPIIIFDKEKKSDKCWINEAISPAKLFPNDGFYKRTDQDWGFRVQVEHSIDDIVQVDLGPCLTDDKQVSGIALNLWILRLEVSPYEPAREFGIFLINQDGRRREYTLRIEKDEKMYMRVRDGNQVTDNLVQVVPSNVLQYDENYPHPFYKFPISILLQMDNQGSDILYLLSKLSQDSVHAQDIDSDQMIAIDNARLPTFGDIQKIGLVGHGGKTEVLIWPLVLLTR